MNTTNSNSNNKTAYDHGMTSLDDWLENDVKKSPLFQRRKPSSTKYSLNHKENEATSIEKESNNIKDTHEAKRLQKEQQQQQDNLPLPTHLIPLIKVYSLLNTIRQNEQLIKENKLNQLHNSRASAPPSPAMSVDSSIDKCQETTNKQKRGNSRTSVDVIVKRQRNTDAARRSRLRKAIKMETLENQVETLKTDNERLRVKVAVLETEVNHATEKELHNRQRVLELETQLANAHKQLVQDYPK